MQACYTHVSKCDHHLRLFLSIHNSVVTMAWVLNASDEVNARSDYPTIIAVCLVLTILMTVVVVLRIYVHASVRQIGSDDCVILGNMVRQYYLSRHNHGSQH